MADDYLAGPALAPDVTLMASWKDGHGKWKRRRVDLATLAAFILQGLLTNDAEQDDRLDALQASLQGFADALRTEQGAVDRVTAQAAATGQTVAALAPRMDSLDQRQTADAKALADQGKTLADHTTRLSSAEASISGQGKTQADQGTRLAATEATVKAQGTTLTDQGQRLTANEQTDISQSAKIKALEDKPPQVAAFTCNGKIPAITLGNTVTLTMTVAPLKAGDVLKAGERISVNPTAGMPNSANIAGAFVSADNTVVVQVTAGIALALQATATAFLVAAFRPPA